MPKLYISGSIYSFDPIQKVITMNRVDKCFSIEEAGDKKIDKNRTTFAEALRRMWTTAFSWSRLETGKLTGVGLFLPKPYDTCLL